jgi:hypothetical protein
MTESQMAESLSDRLTALKSPLPDGLIARARTEADAPAPEVMPDLTPSLASFDPPVTGPRRRGLNLIAGLAGVAVVAAGLGAFALEVSGRLHSPASAPAATGASHKIDVAPSFPSLSPVVPAGVIPFLVGDTYAEGSADLPTFVPTKEYGIQYACLGPASISIVSSDGSVLFTSQACSAPGLQGVFVPIGQVSSAPVSLRVETTSSTTWELRVEQSSIGAPYPYETTPPSPFPG